MKLFYLSLVFVIFWAQNCWSVLPLECGERLTNEWTSPRIIGGSDAQLGDYPWQVSLHVYIPIANKSLHICGGTYISDEWILTAAHCLDTGLEMQSYFVVIGIIDFESENAFNFHKYFIKRFILHNKWDENQTLNDISLIQLHKKVDLKINNQTIAPICLTSDDTNLLERGIKCYATGWGAVWAKFNETYFEIGPTSKTLKQVMAPVFDTNKCRNIHLNKSKEAIVDLNTEICAGGSDAGGSGVCVSDSGGPLQCQTSDNKWYQIGIISWTFMCAAPGVPDVYTRVSKYYDWIQTTISEYS